MRFAPKYGRLGTQMGRGVQPSEAQDANDVEQTEVRARSAVDKSRSPETLSAKLERAREAFEQLGDDDPRARLLQVAMLRRDEVLLDALLRRLDSSQR
jgi:DNA/RNA-binding domain of Phe-tRNA-synthetase-like protein